MDKNLLDRITNIFMIVIAVAWIGKHFQVPYIVDSSEDLIAIFVIYLFIAYHTLSSMYDRDAK